MSAGIDVLAVMDRSIEILHGNAWGEDREDLQEARAAVAELIEAAKAYRGHIKALQSGRQVAFSIMDEAASRVDAALARMGEGA